MYLLPCIYSKSETLVYCPSGLEPKKILILGKSGLFCCARAHNEKIDIQTEGLPFNVGKFTTGISAKKTNQDVKSLSGNLGFKLKF